MFLLRTGAMWQNVSLISHWPFGYSVPTFNHVYNMQVMHLLWPIAIAKTTYLNRSKIFIIVHASTNKSSVTMSYWTQFSLLFMLIWGGFFHVCNYKLCKITVCSMHIVYVHMCIQPFIFATFLNGNVMGLKSIIMQH